MRDLPRRLGVAAVGIPAVLGVLYVGGWTLGIPMALLAALGAGEVYRLAETKGVRAFRWPGMIAAGGIVLLAVAHPSFVAFAPWGLSVILCLGGLTLTVALWSRGPQGSPMSAVAVTVLGPLYAGVTVAFIPLLHALPTRMAWGEADPSPWLGTIVVTLPLAATWVGDSAAYLAGTAWGRSKLFPAISPNKSWVGAWAGVAGAAGATALWTLVARGPMPGSPVGAPALAAAMGAILGVGAIVGDLGESLLKREVGVKDSGTLFPGHGGVLDRLDALSFTLPLAYALLVGTEALS
ncbi:MAG: phosphatidate cytidylyltransferase [Gemmatimonadota bacterium]